VIDIHSGTWLAVKAWAEGELTSKKARLESIHSDHDTTTLTRGEIITLRKLLGMPKQTSLREPNNN